MLKRNTKCHGIMHVGVIVKPKDHTSECKIKKGYDYDQTNDFQILIQKMPHITPHTERVLLFKKYVANNKAKLGLSDATCASPHSTLITVHR